jgi:hypothetical protein
MLFRQSQRRLPEQWSHVRGSTSFGLRHLLRHLLGRLFGFSKAQGEQFDGSNPDDQDCKCHRVVFEPSAHDLLHACWRIQDNV